MSVVLLVLKIIGIILLVLLGLILLAVLAILFVPVQYRIAGQVENTIDSILAWAKISWLLHLISITGQYAEQKFTYKLRILGIPIRLEKMERLDTQTRKSSKKEKHKKKEKSKPEAEKQLKPEEKLEHEKQLKVEEKPEHEKQLKVEEKPEKRKKKSTFFQKIKAFPGMIRFKLEKIKEKLANFREVASRIKQELRDEKNRAAAAVVFRELKYLLRHISPRKVTADVNFGMADPAATGQILGVISTLPFVYRYKLQIYPDFATETTYFNGTFELKGHIRGIHFILMAIHLFKDKNIQHLIQRYRNS